jgi:hypothetical protein
VGLGALSGLRLQGGVAFDAEGRLGLEGGAFLLELRLAALAGFRYLDLDETLEVQDRSTPFGQPLPGTVLGADPSLGSTVSRDDHFRTPIILGSWCSRLLVQPVRGAGLGRLDDRWPGGGYAPRLPP